MKRFLIALALTCLLSGSALAGHIDTCGAPAPVSGETESSVVATVILSIINAIV